MRFEDNNVKTYNGFTSTWIYGSIIFYMDLLEDIVKIGTLEETPSHLLFDS